MAVFLFIGETFVLVSVDVKGKENAFEIVGTERGVLLAGKYTGTTDLHGKQKPPSDRMVVLLVGVSLKDLAKPSKINCLQAASKGLYPATKCNSQ